MSNRPERAVETGRRLKLTCAIDLEPRQVDWFWPGFSRAARNDDDVRRRPQAG